MIDLRIQVLGFGSLPQFKGFELNKLVPNYQAADTNLHNYFNIHVCLSLRRPAASGGVVRRHVPLPIFIMFRVQEAQSDRCWARRSRAMYTQF